MGLLAMVGFIFTTPLSLKSNDDASQGVRRSAEVVGLQLIQLYQESLAQSQLSKVSPGRGIASVDTAQDLEVRTIGTIGNDPYGKPFHYRILSRTNQKVHVLVWSTGPNSKVDTPALEDESRDPQISFLGDDDGLVLSSPISIN